MAARTDAEQARRGLDGLRDELTSLREYAATARAEAAAALENATAARQVQASDDRRFEELRTEVSAVLASVYEYKHGFEEARQAAVAARRDAEAARTAIERAGTVSEATTEKFTEVWREMLNVGRRVTESGVTGEGSVVRYAPRVSVPKKEEAPAREPRTGFDDQTSPMAVLDLKGKFKQLNPAFSKLVGYREQDFGKATWPSVLDRNTYREQVADFERLVAGEIENVELHSTYMHGQGLMVPVVGEVRLGRDAKGNPDHLLMVAEDRAGH
jgi:PAS domain S-box-containing protein